MRILLIEDDKLLSERVAELLGEEGHEIDICQSGADGIAHAEMLCHNLAIVDLGLPDMSGNEVITHLRRKLIDIPVLVLSARTQLENKLEALELGADDFMIKPFHKDELLARIHALVRRSEGLNSHVITCGDLRIDIRNKQLTCPKGPVSLTRKEFELLELMAMRKGRPVSKTAMMNHLYGGREEPEMKIIDVFICTLRKKMQKANDGQHCIETIWGRGYALREEESIHA